MEDTLSVMVACFFWFWVLGFGSLRSWIQLCLLDRCAVRFLDALRFWMLVFVIPAKAGISFFRLRSIQGFKNLMIQGFSSILICNK
jgi:hypothetical protein